MNYLIIDKTANHEAIFIDHMGENCNLEENAIVFKDEIEAQEHIDNNGWGIWAKVKETDYPVNNTISFS